MAINKEFDLTTYQGRISHLIVSYGAPKATKLLGYSKAKTYRMIKGEAEYMTFTEVSMLAKAAGFSINWVENGEGQPEKGGHLSVVDNSTKIMFLDSDEEPPIRFSNQYLSEVLKVSPVASVLVKVQDDSMVDTLHIGDIALINGDIATGDGLFAIQLNGSSVVRRLQHQPNGSLRIICDSSSYDDHILTAEEADNVRIVGKVVWHGG